MSDRASDFAPEQYRGFLILLARSAWDAALRDWGDPSDIVHQTLLEAHQKRDTFQGETAAEFAAWLRTILSNNLYDVGRAVHRAKRDVRRKQSLDAALAESSARLGCNLSLDDPSPSKLAATAEQLNRLADALERLPVDQREAITCHHLRGMSVEATAVQMNRTRPAVAGLLRRGLKQLGSLLGERSAR
ncbi:sigma-70 family RNA polymerase sigma factor [Gemmata sp. JC673]|uniref:Sigma-70 family RNA polymerase sigma factor n=1 Tax=Gemmata algarum TaxID=2975278 RepID=A0ABU5F7F4_9BACT|nr:sigma-70 family RNA polymerase sigma factor [Gemmata algarum]MDY3561791.1 sigma-70 family RNA polymerase sigma factor [Gemmata algarum]